MTRLEAEILAGLAPASLSIADAGWLAPREFGGADASGHATRATRLVAKGWVQRRYRRPAPGEPSRGGPAGSRGSCLYRITPLGLQALHNHLTLRRRVAA